MKCIFENLFNVSMKDKNLLSGKDIRCSHYTLAKCKFTVITKVLFL